MFADINWTMSILGTIVLSVILTVVVNLVLRNRK
jgi:hypothetical protein